MMWVAGYALVMLAASAIAGWHWGRFVREPGEEPVGHIFGALFWPIPFLYCATIPLLFLLSWPFAKTFRLASGNNGNVTREWIGELSGMLGFDLKPPAPNPNEPGAAQ